MNEEKVKNNRKGLIISLILILIAIISFVIYFVVKNNNEKEIVNDNQEVNALSLEEYLNTKAPLYGSVEEYIKEFAKYTPNDYSSEDISMMVWWYIYFKDNNGMETTKALVTEVDEFLYNMFDLKNIDVSERNATEDSPFTLKKTEEYYEISAEPIGFGIFEFESYEIKNNQLLIKTIISDDTGSVDDNTLTYEFNGERLVLVES